MATSSGFFDSINGDRRYTAVDMGHIMDYLVTDGVYSYYPETGVVYDDKHSRNRTIPPFQVSAVEGPDSWKNPSGYAVAIGPGRAWFDHTWTLVTTPEIVPLSAPDPTGDKIDCIALQMNKSESVRANRFVVIESKMPFDGANVSSIDGHPPTDYQSKLPMVPRPPEVIAAMGVEDEFAAYGTYNQLKNYFPDLQGHYMHDDEVHDVPIAYIYRPVGATSIHDYQIFSAVGTSDCPFVASIGDGAMSFEHLYLNWSSQFDDYLEGYIDKVSEEYTAWQANLLAIEPEWDCFLDEKSADFMRFLKMQDRAYHVWYQGSVNWTYEYIRNLNAENEEFESKWKTAIQKAQSLLENGFTEYTQKIDEILRKFEDIDNLADSQMAELEKRVDEAIAGLESDFDAQMRQYVKEAVTAEMELVVNQVVEQMSPSILESMQAQVQQLVEDELSSSFEDRLKGLETDLEQYKDEVLESSKRQLEQEITSFNEFQNDLQSRIEKALEDYLTADGNLQDALDKVAEEALSNQVRQQWSEVQETWSEEIQDTLYEQLARDINFLFVECFEEEEKKLIEWIKSQLQPLTQEAVDTRFTADFEAKQTELENRIDSAITKGLEDVDQRLLDLAADPEFIAKVVAAIPIVSTEGPGLAPQIPSE